jgi:thymidine kinase
MDMQSIWISFSIGVTLFNGLIFVLIKFNDLKHLDENMKLMLNKVGELSERISKMEGICSVCAKKSRTSRKR